jgi:hypothetical protein
LYLQNALTIAQATAVLVDDTPAPRRRDLDPLVRPQQALRCRPRSNGLLARAESPNGGLCARLPQKQRRGAAENFALTGNCLSRLGSTLTSALQA